MNRLSALRQRWTEQREWDAFLVSEPQNRRYLSGFTGSAGWLLISDTKACIAVDFRYVEQAKIEADEFEVLHIKGDLPDWLPGLASDLGIGKLAFEADQFSFSMFQKIRRAVNSARPRLQLLPTTGLVESIRAIKEPGETDFIARAVELAHSAFEHIKPFLHPGLTEKELAWELEKFLRENGSETVPFDIIVASGPNSALPHARPSDRAIMENEPVVIDLGARFRGYCSDLTRTLCLGKEDETFSRIHDIVLGAQLTAMATIEAGMSGDQADRLGRTVIEHANYGQAFGHGLGHGVGLETHECPRLGPNSTDVLANEMTFTVEPGIYIPGWGGVRIEDTVIMHNGKVKNISLAARTA